MVRYCVLCNIKQVKKSSLIFHKFPKNPKIHNLWKKICGYSERDDASRLYVCSNHFIPSDYVNFGVKNWGGRVSLTPEACPSVSIPSRPKAFESVFINTDEVELLKLVKEEYSDTTREEEEPLPSTSGFTVEILCHSNTTDDGKFFNIPRKERSVEPCIDEITEEDILSPPRAKKFLKLAKSYVRKQAKEIKALRQKYRRLSRRLVSLKNLVHTLKTGNTEVSGNG